MLKEIVEARALEGRRMWVRFDDGIAGEVAIDDLVSLDGVCEGLAEPVFFGRIQVNRELGTICWPTGADLDRELLRETFAAGFGPSSEMLPELIRLDELVAEQLGHLLAQFEQPGGLSPDIDIDEAVIAIYSLMASQLIMYVSMEKMTPGAVKAAVARQIEIVFSGLRANER